MIRATRLRRFMALPVLALLLGPTTGAAQQDNRIDFRLNPAGANDANNQVGSGGLNRPPTPAYLINSANLYITGNVTGGRAFQAFSPVSDPLTFSGQLGSSRLDSFRRDSVSIQDVLSGRTPATITPYYSRQRTTTSLGTLSAGFEQLNSGRTQGIYRLPYQTPQYTMPRFGIPFAPELALSASTTFLGPGPAPAPQAQVSPFLQPLPTLTSLGPLTTPWFGLSVRPVLADPFRQAATHEEYGREEVSFGAVAFPELIDLVERSAALDRLTEAPTDTAWSTAQPGEAADGQAPAAADARPVPGEPATDSGYDLPTLTSPGADVYQDMLTAIQFAAEADQRAEQIRAATAAVPAAAEQFERDLSVIRSMLYQPVESFAGSADRPVQNLIRQAEELVREGKYYQAKGLYERALIFDRSNPLVLLGLGHAMLAAGEYYSAALTISGAIELFNGIAYFNFDLRTFVTEPDTLEKRRADLERRLELREDLRFRFLLGYAEYYSDLAKYGLPNLKLAAEQAPEHSGIARLHDLLTTHRLPTP